jgi:Transglutaminase-like superfamily
MMQTWQRFRRLSRSERGIVLEAATGLLTSWLVVRLLGFRICRYVFEKPLSGRNSWNSKSGEADALAVARRIAHLEAVTAANLFFRTSCLEHSLVLCRMLRQRGMNADLRIGARKEGNRFEAHAWVELDGSVVDGSGSDHLHFVPFKHSESSMETQTN